MKTTTRIALSVLVTLMALTLLAWAQHNAQGKEVTLKGEVVDLQCYLVHPDMGQGPDHAKCAQMCMNKGLPVGFLTEEGKLYLLLGPGHDSVRSMVSATGETVTLKGTLIERNGMTALQLSTDGASQAHGMNGMQSMHAPNGIR